VKTTQYAPLFVLTWAEIIRGRDRIWYVLEWASDSQTWAVWTLGLPIYPNAS